MPRDRPSSAPLWQTTFHLGLNSLLCKSDVGLDQWFPESTAGLYVVGDLFKDGTWVPTLLKILVQWFWDVSFKKITQSDCCTGKYGKPLGKEISPLSFTLWMSLGSDFR